MAVLEVSFREWTNIRTWFFPACSITLSYTISFISYRKGGGEREWDEEEREGEGRREEREGGERGRREVREGGGDLRYRYV